MYKSAVESLKAAKADEFPLEHMSATAPKKAPAKPRSAPKKEIVAEAVKVSKAKEVALKEKGAAAGAPIPTKPAKGLEEMRARMAAIRSKRGSKKE
jgi:hypothetical protein